MPIFGKNKKMNNQWSENGGNQEDVFSLFNLNDFKKWMHTQKEEIPSKQNFMGLHVESKVGFKRLISRMDVQDGEEEELAKEFKNHGGVISDIDEHNFLIEVDSGSFIIHKMYVKMG